ncbi:MAG: hypothetical protein JJU41_10900 [Bacteroidetes bacterium]|nr:hypothetical protein [Bacteroidota bacterium]MCH8523909.1 hypothetical protein [Balneolales bacterium]
MKNISLKLDESVFEETERIINEIDIPRNRYINDAVARYNVEISRKLIREQLRKDSELVRENSMRILSELDGMED